LAAETVFPATADGAIFSEFIDAAEVEVDEDSPDVAEEVEAREA
jgi:hypothetical protein